MVGQEMLSRLTIGLYPIRLLIITDVRISFRIDGQRLSLSSKFPSFNKGR